MWESESVHVMNMLYPFMLTVAIPKLVVLLDITFYSYLPTTGHIDQGTDSHDFNPIYTPSNVTG